MPHFATMKPRSSGCPHHRHLLLLSLVGILSFCAQLLGTSGHNVTEKAGTCPQTKVTPDRGNCTEECTSDASCGTNQKCCQNGCGTSCQTPNEKPGHCPYMDPLFPVLGPCQSNCGTDSDCSDTLKCCKTGCGALRCSNPEV